jgi:hypothetical protein
LQRECTLFPQILVTDNTRQSGVALEPNIEELEDRSAYSKDSPTYKEVVNDLLKPKDPATQLGQEKSPTDLTTIKSSNDTSSLQYQTKESHGAFKPSAAATWLGYTRPDQMNREYCQIRHQLADAAYFGRWSDVFKTLQYALENFEENWINAWRPSMYFL